MKINALKIEGEDRWVTLVAETEEKWIVCFVVCTAVSAWKRFNSQMVFVGSFLKCYLYAWSFFQHAKCLKMQAVGGFFYSQPLKIHPVQIFSYRSNDAEFWKVICNAIAEFEVRSVIVTQYSFNLRATQCGDSPLHSRLQRKMLFKETSSSHDCEYGIS